MRTARTPHSGRIHFAIALLSVVVVVSIIGQVSPVAAQGAGAYPEHLDDTPDTAGEKGQVDPAAAERDVQARIEFERGRAAYGKGDYRIAWGHFREAYVLSRRPQLLYNVGQAADRLGLSQDALKAFRMYLQALPDAENRAEVEARIRALEGKAGAVPQAAATDAHPGAAASSDGQGTARAQEGSDTGDTQDTDAAPDAAEPSDQPSRTGWYFRGALGLGAVIDGWSDGAATGNMTGAGFALDLAAGITLFPGLALGGVLYWNYAPGGSVSQESFPSTDLDGLGLIMLGPMVDWYMRPRRDGFHIQGAVVLAALSANRGAFATGAAVGTETAGGAGLVGGAGWEFPLTRDIAWGAAGRIAVARLSEDTTSHTVLNLSAVATVTWY